MSDPNSKAGITEMLAIAKERDLAAMLIILPIKWNSRCT